MTLTHAYWREDGSVDLLVGTAGYEDTDRLTELPASYSEETHAPDPATRTFTFSMSAVQARLLAELAAIRWERTQQFVYDGVVTWAEPAIKNLTAKVVARQVLGLTEPILYKLADGEFRTWDDAGLAAYGAAIDAHMQACFDREAELSLQIVSAATLDELPDITAGWPTGFPESEPGGELPEGEA